MKTTMEQLYEELIKISKDLSPWFNIERVKPYMVEVWGKDEKTGKKANLFDITANNVFIWGGRDEGFIPNRAIPIIRKIQNKLEEIECLTNNSKQR